MGREVRLVRADWQHPKDARGVDVPLLGDFNYTPEEVQEGLEEGWLSGEPPHYGLDVMPDWPEAERTHLQMYETCSEGTPISPVCATAEELARWLADNGASAFGNRTATYEQWLATIRRGSAVSAVFTPSTGFRSGVEAFGDIDNGPRKRSA